MFLLYKNLQTITYLKTKQLVLLYCRLFLIREDKHPMQDAHYPFGILYAFI